MLFLIGIPLSSVIGGPLMTWLISSRHGVLFGLAGWRFMFLIVGLPALILGIVCCFYLTDRPGEAAWLSTEEAAFLQEDLGHETASHTKYDVKGSLLSARVWLLCLQYFGVVYGLRRRILSSPRS